MSYFTKSLFRLTVVTFISAMLTPVTTWADFCEDRPLHRKCQSPPPPPPPPPPAVTPLYTVTLDGPISSNNVHDAWGPSQPQGKAIGLNAHSTMRFSLDFFVFRDPTGNCFPGAVTPDLSAAYIRVRNIKGGKRAEASWWFLAKNEDLQDYNYVLQMYGVVPNDIAWPADAIFVMPFWEMNDASGNGETTLTACLGEGLFFDDPETLDTDEGSVLVVVQTH